MMTEASGDKLNKLVNKYLYSHNSVFGPQWALHAVAVLLKREEINGKKISC
jgi:hypothetical protein